VKSVIHVLKNCPEEFHKQRRELVNRLKMLVGCRNHKNKIKDISDLINNDIIVGKSKFLNYQSRNELYSFWYEIIKSIFVSNNFGNFMPSSSINV